MDSPEKVAETQCEVHGTTIRYSWCPYVLPCGDAPCEKGQECPATVKEVRIVPWPIPTDPPPYPPTIIYSTSAGYTVSTDGRKKHADG